MLIITIFDLLFEVYWWILIARFLLSWLPNIDYGHPVIRFVHRVTDPIVHPFQGIIPPYGSVDFSPLLIFLVLRLAYPLFKRLLIQILLLFG